MTKKATLIVEFEYDDDAELKILERAVGGVFDALDHDTSHIEVAPGDMEQAFGVKKP